MLNIGLSLAVAAVPTVQLAFDRCIEDRDQIRNLVGIEIGFDRLVPKGDYRIELICTPRTVAVRVRPNPKTVPMRVVPRDDLLDPSGTRILALHIAELMRDMPAQPISASLTVAEDAPVPSFEADKTSGAMRVGAAPSIRYVTSPVRWAIGARAHIGIDLASEGSSAWSFGIDAGFEQADSQLSLGNIRSSVVSAAVVGGGRFDLADDLALFTVVGARGGWAWLSGSAEDDAVDGSGQGPWFGPIASLRLRYGGTFGVSVSVEGGWTIAGVVGDVGENDPVGLTNGWLGADLALDWSFVR